MKTVVWLLAAMGAIPLLVAAGETAPPPVAAKFLSLFDRLRSAEASRQRTGKSEAMSFQLTQNEVNDYIRYALKAAARPGVESATIKFFPNNYISTFLVVDFDAIERWSAGTVPTLLRPVLNGKKAIWVDYRFQARDGLVTFSVEKAYYEKMRLPAFFVSKMIQIVAARQPERYDTSKPLPLPFGLRELSTAEQSVAGHN